MAFPSDPLDVEVSLGLGADLTAAPSTWTFTDVTSYIYLRDRIQISRGRADEAQDAEPSKCLLTTDNRDARWSPRNPTGAWYGQVRKGTPLRVRIRRVKDTFARTASSSWGSADSGQAWTTSGGSASDYSVSSGVGNISLGTVTTQRTARLTTSLADYDMYAEFTVPAVLVGGNLQVYLVGRSTDSSNEYQFRLIFAPSGVLSVRILDVTGGSTTFVSASVTLTDTYTTGSTIAVRVSMSGQTLRMRAWNMTGSEPSTWTVEGTDDTRSHGTLGIIAELGAAVSNTLPLVVTVDNVQVHVTRFAGFLTDLPPRWDLSNRDRYVPVAAAGLLRRLAQRVSPTASAVRRTILGNAAPVPIAYWPLEDEVGAEQAASALSGLAPMSVGASSPDFAVVGLGDGVLSAVDVAVQGTLRGTIPASSAAAWSFSCLVNMDQLSSPPILIAVLDGSGWTVDVNALNQTISVDFFVGGVYQTSLDANPVFFSNGETCHVIVTVSQSGANAAITLSAKSTLRTATDSDTILAATVRVPGTITINPPPVFDASPASCLLGHYAIYDSVYTDDLVDAAGGYVGEQAHTRFLRLCEEEGVTASCAAATSQAMGPQGIETFLDLLRECEDTDGGYLYDALDFGLALQGHTERENQSAALALDYDVSGHVGPPFEPIDDDQNVLNDSEVKREGGSSSRATVDSPDSELSTVNVGRYDEQVTLNVYTDAQTADHAGWRVHKGTWPGFRYPTLSLNLNAAASLIDAWLSAGLGFRTTVDNPPDDLGPDQVDLIMDGYGEELGLYDWDVAGNCSLAGPWRVGALATTSGDTSDYLMRLVPDTSYLVTAVTSSATSWLVFSDPYWTTTSDDFPCDLRFAGELVTLTAVAPVATDTFTRTVAAGSWGTADSGQTWTLDPGAGASSADYSTTGTRGRILPAALNVDSRAVIDIGSTDFNVRCDVRNETTPASGQVRVGVVGRYVDSSHSYYAEMQVATTAIVTLRVLKRNAAATVLASVVTGFSNPGGSFKSIRFVGVGSRLRARIWNTGTVEPDVWHIDVTDTDITTGTSAGVFVRNETAVTTHAFLYDNLEVSEPKTWTVTRSVNGVSKSQSALQIGEIDDPGVLGL